jgi:hypothetical protein
MTLRPSTGQGRVTTLSGDSRGTKPSVTLSYVVAHGIVGGRTDPMTKAEWLAEGAALGARASGASWEIGTWLVRGEQAFLGTAPNSKKQRRIYFSNRRANWLALMREAEGVTNLAEATLRKYAQVARNGVRVDGVHFSHHIEVQRCSVIDEKNKRCFDANAAQEILRLAEDKGWKVADTRAEVKRRFPTPKSVETALEKAKRVMLEVLMTVEPQERIAFLNALAQEIDAECNMAVVKILETEDDTLDTFYGVQY